MTTILRKIICLFLGHQWIFPVYSHKGFCGRCLVNQERRQNYARFSTKHS